MELKRRQILGQHIVEEYSDGIKTDIVLDGIFISSGRDVFDRICSEIEESLCFEYEQHLYH